MTSRPLITGGPGLQDATAPAITEPPPGETPSTFAADALPTPDPPEWALPSPTAIRDTQEAGARSDIRLALATHLTRQYPGLASQLDQWVEPIVERAYEVLSTNPQFLDLLREDVRWLQALTDEDMMASAISGRFDLAPLFDDIVDTYYDLGATQMAQLELSRRSQGLQQTFEGHLIESGLIVDVLSRAGVDIGQARELETMSPEQKRDYFQKIGRQSDPELVLGVGDIPEAMGRIDRSVFEQPGTWALVDGKLVLDFSSERLEGDPIISRYVIQTEPGTEVANTLDALVVLAESLLNTGNHEILTQPADVPSDEGKVAQLFVGLRDIARWSEQKVGKERVSDALAVADFFAHGLLPNPDPREDTDTIVARRMKESAYPAEFVLAEAAWHGAQLYAEENGQPMILAAGDIFEVASDLADSPFAAEAEEAWRTVTEAEFKELIGDSLDERSELERRAQSGLDSAMVVMEAWDNVSQAIGVYATDMVADYVEGGKFLLGGEIEEGFNKFGEAILPWNQEGVWDWQEHQHVSERIAEAGLDLAGDPDWAQAIDFGSVILFDPLNLLAAGPKSAAKIFAQAMTNPRFARVAINTPAMRAVTRKIAGSQITDAFHAVAEIADGMDTETFRRLVRVAADPASTIGDVQTILIDALPSSGRGGTFWLANGPRRWERRATANGFASVLARHGDNLTDEALEQITLLFSMHKKARGASVVDAGFLNEFLDTLDTTRLTTAEREHWMLRAADALDEQRGTIEVLDGAAIAKTEEAKIARGANPMPAGHRDLPAIAANLDQTDDAIARIHEYLPGASDDAINQTLDTLVRNRDALEARRTRLQSRVDEVTANRQTAHQQVSDAVRLEKAADSRASEEHFVLARLYHEFYEAEAEKLGLKQLQTTNPFTGNKLYDWTPVRGEAPAGDFFTRLGDNPDADLLREISGPGQLSDKQLLELRAAGYLNTMNKVPLPVSQWELALYKALEHNPTLHGKMIQMLRKVDRATPSQWLKKAFAANLLLNPMTGFKAHLDETIRFLADTGDYAGFAHASLAGLPGLGEYIDRALRAGFKINPQAAPYIRTLDPFGGAVGSWKWLNRPTKKLRGQSSREYLDQADRWVNGVLVRDDIFMAYAEAIETGAYTLAADGTAIPGESFVRWWDQGGNRNVRRQALKAAEKAGIAEVNERVAFRAVHAAFETMLDNLVEPKVREQVKRAMLRAGHTGELVEKQWLREFLKIPGQESARGGVIGSAFDLFFGSPAQRRGSVFFDRYHEYARKTFTEAYEGRIITIEKLIELGEVADATEAAVLIARGTSNPVVRRLVNRSGMVTEQMIDAHAASYAARRADDLMYRLTATSIAGQIPETALAFPYTRAQMDFLSWWSNHLTRPMQARLSNETRLSIMNRMPRLNQAIEAVESVPLNLRALSRYSHVLSAFSDPSVQEGEGPLGKALNVVDTLTFLPLQMSTEILADLVPPPGPIPTWLLDTFADDEQSKLYEAMSLLWPTIEYSDDNPWDFLDYVLPASRRSLRRAAGNVALRGVGSGIFGTDPTSSDAAFVYKLFGVENQAPGTSMVQKTALAQLLTTEGLPPAHGAPAFEDKMAKIVHDSIRTQGSAQAWDPLKAYLGLPPQYFDRAAFASYRPVLDAWDDLLMFGAIPTDLQVPVDPDTFEPSDGPDAQPLLIAWYDRWEAANRGEGEPLTREDLYGLADRLGDVFNAADDVQIMPGVSMRDYLVANNPGLGVNLVSTSECSPQAPTEWRTTYCSVDGRIQNQPLGEDGRTWWDEATSNDWIQPRDTFEWMRDVVEIGNQAISRVLRGAWEQMTNRPWGDGLRKVHETMPVQGGVPAFYAQIFTDLGVGSIQPGAAITYGDLRDMISERRGSLQTGDISRNRLLESDVGAMLSQGGHLGPEGAETGRAVLGYIESVYDYVKETDPDLSYTTWPQEQVDGVKEAVRYAIDYGIIREEDYVRDWQPMFGPLDYEFTGPPTDPAELETTIRVSPEDVSAGLLTVIDGDGLSLLLADGTNVPVRLLGINAPEVNQPGYQEATDRLRQAISSADEVLLAQWQPRTFGTSQAPDPSGRQRVFLWLYINGIPIFDPSQFTATNQRGVQSGAGNLIDFDAILNAATSEGAT